MLVSIKVFEVYVMSKQSGPRNVRNKENLLPVGPSVKPVVVAYQKAKSDHKDDAQSRNLALWNRLTLSDKKNHHSRMAQYVILLGAPDVPRTHPSVDDSYHAGMDIDYEWMDLLERGKNTLNYIHHKNNANSPCPNVIFLRSQITDDEDALTKKINHGHTLYDFKTKIANEKQHPIEFHLAGHSDGSRIGPITQDKRLDPETLADLIDMIIENIGEIKDPKFRKVGSEKYFTFKELLMKKEIVFKFHACNSAYVDCDANDTSETIQQQILNDSLIGRFYHAMVENGYENIKVIGHRGFYQGLNNGSGIRVSNAIRNPSREMNGSNAEFSIARNKHGEDIVTIPRQLAHATFEVTLPSNQPRYIHS